MKTLRTFGIIVAVALAAIGLALLPSADEATQARPGISVGETSAGGNGEGAEPASVEAADGKAVALPTAAAPEQPVRGTHTDSGVGAMEADPSPSPEPEPAPAPVPEPAPAPQPRPSGGSGSSSGTSSGSGGSSSDSGSSSGGSTSTPPRPSGVCEWDDGERQCDDDSHDDDDDDGGDDEADEED